MDTDQKFEFLVRVRVNIGNNIQKLQILIFSYEVDCTKFGYPALSSEFYNYALNTDFVASHHLKAEAISKLTVHSQFLKNFFLLDPNFRGYPKSGHNTTIYLYKYHILKTLSART